MLNLLFDVNVELRGLLQTFDALTMRDYATCEIKC